MAKIKTEEMHMERWIKVKRRSFDALLIMRATWL